MGTRGRRADRPHRASLRRSSQGLLREYRSPNLPISHYSPIYPNFWAPRNACLDQSCCYLTPPPPLPPTSMPPEPMGAVSLISLAIWIANFRCGVFLARCPYPSPLPAKKKPY